MAVLNSSCLWLAAPLVVAASSCAPVVQQQTFSPVTLTVKATATGEGEFAIAGTTNLPEETQLTVIALRYLTPTQPVAPDAPPTYSILDYQATTVVDGQWSADLNIWQVASDGRYQEPWQLQNQKLDLDIQPDDAVQFLVTLGPQQMVASLYKTLWEQRLQLDTPLLRTTPDGETLLLAGQPMAVDLPTATTAPPIDDPARRNGGWGERYLLVPEPPLPYTLKPLDERQTTAPPSEAEMLY